MPPLLRIPLERRLPHAADDVYAWCTDFRPDDTDRSGGLIRGREILERSGDRIRMISTINGPHGVLRRVQEVRLEPEARRWHVRIVDGDGVGSRHVYQVSPLPNGGSRLRIRFGYASPGWGAYLRSRRQRAAMRGYLNRLWDRFVEEMGRELAAVSAPRVAVG